MYVKLGGGGGGGGWTLCSSSFEVGTYNLQVHTSSVWVGTPNIQRGHVGPLKCVWNYNTTTLPALKECPSLHPQKGSYVDPPTLLTAHCKLIRVPALMPPTLTHKDRTKPLGPCGRRSARDSTLHSPRFAAYNNWKRGGMTSSL